MRIKSALLPSYLLGVAVLSFAASAPALPPIDDPPDPPGDGGGGGGSSSSSGGPPPSCSCPIDNTVCSTSTPYVQGAVKGDLVFLKSNGTIGMIMAAFGLNWTHVGMMLSQWTVRHNTLSMKSVTDSAHARIDPIEFGGDCLYGDIDMSDVAIAPKTMISGTPGLHTASYLAWEMDYEGGSGFFWSGELKIAKVKPDSTSQSRAQAAAAQLANRNAGYNVYAFSQFDKARDTKFYVPNAHPEYGSTSCLFAPNPCTVYEGGSVCSGSVLQAWRDAEGQQGGFHPRAYSSIYRETIADVVYSTFLGLAASNIDTIDTSGCPGWGPEDDATAAESAARQVINAFAYGAGNDFGNHSHWSAAKLGEGSAVSPDDLMDQINGLGGDVTPYQPSPANAVIVPSQTTCWTETTWVPCAC